MPARRVVSTLSRALGVLMLVGVALNFVGVFSRYALSSAIFWVEEVLVLITIWGVFLGCVVIAWKGEHLSMDLIAARLSGWPRALLRGAIAATLVVVSAFVAWQSWQIVSLFAATDAVSAGARIPKVIPHAALLVGFALTALVVLLRIRAYLSGDFRD